MIRYSVNNDREGIISLWHEAFGDSRSEIEFFLDNKYIPENTVVCEENGEIISLLFLLNGEMHINGQDYPAYYLYAACTSKKFRGKGIMGQMLDYSKNLAADRGVDFICLMPAEKSLFDYYSKFGYMPIFRRKTVKITAEELSKISFFTHNSSDFSFKPAYKLRNEAFEKTDFFKWDKSSVEFAFEHTKLYGGNLFLSNKGYCLYTRFDGVLTVKETTLTHDLLAKKLKEIANINNVENIELILPCDYDFFSFEHEISYNGMILTTRNIDDKIIKSIHNAYLGLTLD